MAGCTSDFADGQDELRAGTSIGPFAFL